MSKKSIKTKLNEYATPDVDAKHLKQAEHLLQSNPQVAHPAHLLARVMALEEKASKPAPKVEAPKPVGK